MANALPGKVVQNLLKHPALPGKTAPSVWQRIADFARKHPAATTGAAVGTAGTIGTAATLPHAAQEGRKLEAEIMQNYTGAPSGKFVYAELQEFSARKKYLGEKIALHKIANDLPTYSRLYGSGEEGFAKEVGKGIAQSGIAALGKLIRGTARTVKERMVLDKRREALVDHIMQFDPIVSVQERVNPGSTIQAYSTMVKFAPTLSTDPNVVTSFLREASQSEGGINPLTVQQLAKTEESINKALEGRMR